MTEPKVYIVLVNFNGHNNTIETIESLAKQSYQNFQIIVVDNNTPASLQIIKDWADGKQIIEFNPPEEIKKFSLPYFSKPVSWIEYEREQAETGGDGEKEKSFAQSATAFQYPLILVQARNDIGF